MTMLRSWWILLRVINDYMAGLGPKVINEMLILRMYGKSGQMCAKG